MFVAKWPEDVGQSVLPGFTITLLKATDDELNYYLDVPTKTIGFTPGSVVTADSASRVIVESVAQKTQHAHTNGHAKPSIGKL
ncbi:hypothetical protein V1508DRAFT_395397 [Lipomyces doorenjongii]|uniref:uncharacterized protein n=1 Tax=Lipomyces doorenjongii TaxID=383834 RepID=UPI0034CD32CA